MSLGRNHCGNNIDSVTSPATTGRGLPDRWRGDRRDASLDRQRAALRVTGVAGARAYAGNS
jgi:hypothetical protein